MTSFVRDKMLFTSVRLYYGNAAPGALSPVKKRRLALFAKIEGKLKREPKQIPDAFEA